jgi:hypothetical protein
MCARKKLATNNVGKYPPPPPFLGKEYQEHQENIRGRSQISSVAGPLIR